MTLRYPGGKSRKQASDWIISHAPEYAEYREPFIGGGGIFRQIDTVKTRWVNDLNTGLIALYRDLATGKHIEWFPVLTGMIIDGEFDGSPQALFADAKAGCGSAAVQYLILNRFSFGGRVRRDRPNRTAFSNPKGWTNRLFSDLDYMANLLAGAKITLGDYEPLLTEPGEGVWIYADPPYVKNTELDESAKLYEHNFSWSDHERLATLLRDCPHKWTLSYDDHELIRDLYQDFRIAEKTWTYTISSDRPSGKEVLVMNY